MSTENKKSFILYNDLETPINSLSDEDAGKLFKAIFEYNSGEVKQELSPSAEMAFIFVKQQLDRNAEKYEETCNKNRENAKKRWDKKKAEDADGCDRIPPDTNNADNDNVPDNDSYNDSDIIINDSKHKQIAYEFIKHYNKKKGFMISPSDKEFISAKKLLDKWNDLDLIISLIPIFFDDSYKFFFNKNKAYYFNSFCGNIQTLISAKDGTYEKPTSKKQDGENQASKLAFIKSIAEGCGNE